MYKTTLKIQGMACNMCEKHVNEQIEKKFKVKKVTSSAKDGETIVLSEDQLDKTLVENAIKDIGFEMQSFESEVVEKKGLFSFGK